MPSSRPWIVVLAGGDGTRLHALTRALYGADLPKQFAVLAGATSLLQQTVERALRLTPHDRIMVVVGTHHGELARIQLAPYPGVELVVQPRNLDTGPGLLLPLVRVLAREPGARIAFLPSDHHIADSSPFLAALEQRRPQLTLLGVTPTGAEIEYGWIVRGPRLHCGAAWRVEQFHEKPAQPVADELFERGALWNTFISIGNAVTYWGLARQYLPVHAAILERYAASIGSLEEPAALAHAYALMDPANFSRDLLSHARELAVTPVTGSGWSDWGSPRRVFESLAGTPELDLLLARIRGPRTEAPIEIAG